MTNAKPQRVKTISEFHQLRGLPKPEHPLISVVNMETVSHAVDKNNPTWIFDFYSISVKRSLNVKYRYGQQEYDFDEGVMFFIAPDQVFGIEAVEFKCTKTSGWILLIHPDFLWNTPLAKTIRKYEYFDYSVNEALFLSEKEETTIINIIQNISRNIIPILTSSASKSSFRKLRLLLNYAERFYHRQFITRKITNHQILDRLEQLLTEYFNSDDLIKKDCRQFSTLPNL